LSSRFSVLSQRALDAKQPQCITIRGNLEPEISLSYIRTLIAHLDINKKVLAAWFDLFSDENAFGRYWALAGFLFYDSFASLM
jgi:hypothetical protein